LHETPIKRKILELKLEMVQMVFIKTKYLVPKFDNAKRQKHQRPLQNGKQIL